LPAKTVRPDQALTFSTFGLKNYGLPFAGQALYLSPSRNIAPEAAPDSIEGIPVVLFLTDQLIAR
jgi:hypothetical protein